MSNYRVNVTRLREILKSGDLTVISDEHKQVILEYYQHCKSANDRLRETEAFLQKGLQTEAVHAAQADPDLLDVVTTLNIPERDVLEMVVAAYNNTHEDKIPPAPAISKSTAEALNQAYASLQSLDDLLKSHRLLSLARAPLTERRHLLLNIIKRDPENNVWKDDQSRWELELVKQLEQFLNRPSVNNDPEEVLNRINIIEDGQWRIKVPEDLQKLANNRRHKAEESLGRRDLLLMVDPLLRAYQSRDLALASKLKADWDRRAEKAHLAGNDPIYSNVNHVFQWVLAEERTAAEQARREAARTKLLNVMKSSASVSDLIRAWQEYQEVVPHPDEQLVRQYKEVKTRREELGRQRFYLVLVSIVASVLIVLLGVVFISLHFINEAKVANRKEKLEANRKIYQSAGFLSKEQESETEQLIKSIDEEGFGQHAEILKYKEDYRGFLQDQAARQTELEALILQCKNLSEKEPSPSLLQSAKSRAKSPAERDRVTKLIDEHDNQHAAWKLRVKKDAEKQLIDLQLLAKEIDGKMEKEDATAATNLYQRAERDLKSLTELEEHPDWKIINTHDKKVWESLGMLRERTKLVRELSDKKITLDQLTQASGGIEALDVPFTQANAKVSTYVSKVNEFIASYPKTRQARSLTDVVKQLDPEVQLERWGESILRLKGDVLALSVKDAQNGLRQLPNVELLPAGEKEKFQALQDFLRRRSLCHFESKSPAMLFDSNFTLPGVKDAWLVKTTVGTPARYYFSEADYNQYTKYFGKSDTPKETRFYQKLELPPKVFEASEKVTGFSFQNILAGEISPQTKLARLWNNEIRPKLDASERSWRQGFVRMAIAIQEAETLDPIGRVLFLNDCYNAIAKTSTIGAKATERQWEYLSTAKNMPDGSDQWLLNAGPGAEGKRLRDHRDNAIAILARFPPLKWDEYLAREKELEKVESSRFPTAPIPMGWLDLSSDRRWMIHGRLSVWERQDVYILVRTGATQPSLLKVGVIQGGYLILGTGINENSLRKGLPCFVMVSTKEPRS